MKQNMPFNIIEFIEFFSCSLSCFLHQKASPHKYYPFLKPTQYLLITHYKSRCHSLLLMGFNPNLMSYGNCSKNTRNTATLRLDGISYAMSFGQRPQECLGSLFNTLAKDLHHNLNMWSEESPLHGQSAARR